MSLFDIGRFDRYQIKNTNISGFEALTPAQQHLVYHLTLAGLAGRDLRFLQTSRHSLPVRNVLECFASITKDDPALHALVTSDLESVWAGGGIYHEGGGERLAFSLPPESFAELCEKSGASLSELEKQSAYEGMYGHNPAPFKSRVDDKGNAGYNAGDASVSHAERKDFIKELRAQYAGQKKQPLVGINSYISRDSDGDLRLIPMASGKMYGEIIDNIINHLENALEYTENNQQHASLETLIQFYRTGNVEDFDTHALAWVKDTDSTVFFTNGFIEAYEDPIKVVGMFQSVVGFAEQESLEFVKNIAKYAQLIEDSLPIEEEFKRKAATTQANAITVVGISGGPNPIVPLGNCLPNQEWIRNNVDSRSTCFMNIIRDRGLFNRELVTRFYPAHLVDTAMEWFPKTYPTWVALHESAGHSSGDMDDDVSMDALGDDYNIIEECRADLVAMVCMGNRELMRTLMPSLTDEDYPTFIKMAYNDYLTNGVLFQLFRVAPGSTELDNTHFRNRQLNSQFILNTLDKLDPQAVAWSENEYGRTLEVIDTGSVYKAFCVALSKVQTIKSKGLADEARVLVDTYGTKVSAELLVESHERVAGLDMPGYVGFTSPLLYPTGDPDKPYIVKQASSFSDDQFALKYAAKYGKFPDAVNLV